MKLFDGLLDKGFDSDTFWGRYFWFVVFYWCAGTLVGAPLFFIGFGIAGLLGLSGWFEAAVGGYIGACILAPLLICLLWATD